MSVDKAKGNPLRMLAIARRGTAGKTVPLADKRKKMNLALSLLFPSPDNEAAGNHSKNNKNILLLN